MNPLTDTGPKAVAQPASETPDPEPMLYPPAYESMMVVGLLGSVYGAHDDADIVSGAVEITLPDPTHYRINRALAQGMGGHSKAAIETLQAHLDANPQDDATKVVLAVSMMCSGDDRWQTVLENVLASSADPNAREAATGVIAYLLSMNNA